jgi:TonB family protein
MAARVRFDPLLSDSPPGAARRRSVLVSVSIGAHVLLFATALFLPETSRVRATTERPVSVVFFVPAPPPSAALPVPEVPRARPSPPRAIPKPEPKPDPPPDLPIPKPEPAPAAEPPARPTPPPPAPPKPRPAVRTNVFGESPESPAALASKESRSVVTASAFDGGARSGGTVAGAARPGAVSAANFDGPSPSHATSPSSRGAVRSVGFDAAPTVEREARRTRERTAERMDADVEILEKPKPDYSDEARRLRIEGDVVLRVTFEASGAIVVHGVLEGLGHGLDEAAMVAARRIKFKPARRNGEPVDLTAILRVVFRLT